MANKRINEDYSKDDKVFVRISLANLRNVIDSDIISLDDISIFDMDGSQIEDKEATVFDSTTPDSLKENFFGSDFGDPIEGAEPLDADYNDEKDTPDDDDYIYVRYTGDTNLLRNFIKCAERHPELFPETNVDSTEDSEDYDEMRIATTFKEFKIFVKHWLRSHSKSAAERSDALDDLDENITIIHSLNVFEFDELFPNYFPSKVYKYDESKENLTRNRLNEAVVAGANGLQYVDDPRNHGKFDAADALIRKLNLNKKD